ncbi:MAG: molybdopterin binding aldehyde oxidase and xanthine dehydrogenase [Hyphomicrobiales bacterium]|nr:molybdopterin binding aldehyde oxidase and xanthine dehydrogenase [Hyphomicrobiales bacterium]
MNIDISRRSLLLGGGALTITVLLPGVEAHASPFGLPQRPALKFDTLASYISIRGDGVVDAYIGKLDVGQGTDIGIAQMIAEELDVPADRVIIVQGDTDTTVNMGGATGSSGIAIGGVAMRNAAAEARRVLVGMASDTLKVPADDIVTANGVASSKSDSTKKVSYADLIGGRWFDVALEWNKIVGHSLSVKGVATPKDPQDYKVVGTSPRRRDVASKILGTEEYVVDVKVPGMVHARLVLPPVAGAVPVSIDEASIKDIPSAKVVHEKDFLAVVAPREWDAIKAARDLKVTWSDAKPNLPGHDGIYDWIRKAAVAKREEQKGSVNTDAAFQGAAKVVEARYEWPFQSHASMGPGCAVVDYQPNGITTLWTGTQKPHYARDGVAAILGVPPEKVHGIYKVGPGSYGRNDAGDVASAAAVISRAVGKPVRLQGMRAEGTAWDPKGPASIHTAKAAIDKDGNVVGWQFVSKGLSRLDVESNESAPEDTLVGQMLGVKLTHKAAFAYPEEAYVFPAKQIAWETTAPLVDRASPLRTSHLRDPLGPQIHFASESFIDEVAYSIGMDPVAFRLKYLGKDRDRAVVKAAAEKAGWQPRTAARRQTRDGKLIGQGIAYAQRSGTLVATVANIEIDPKTGRVWARHMIVAHDAGLIINPGLLRQTIENNIVQSTSRAVLEEVKFDDKMVTSADWVGYPILEMQDAPEKVDILLVESKNDAPTGAGEASTRPTAAAIANAIFDATGVRMRRAPFTPERLKSGLA